VITSSYVKKKVKEKRRRGVGGLRAWESGEEFLYPTPLLLNHSPYILI